MTNTIPENAVELWRDCFFLPAVTTKDIRGAAIGCVPAGTEFMVMVATKKVNWARETEITLIDRSEPWRFTHAYGLKTPHFDSPVDQVYHDEYKLI